MNGTGTRDREFFYDCDNWTQGQVTRTGPDGVYTSGGTDAANRVVGVQRSSTSFPVVQAIYAYKLNGWLESATYSTGTSTWYTYDAAGRVKVIDHRGIGGMTQLKLEYDYLDNDLVDLITESDQVGAFAWTDFGYDDRGRLTSEVRTGQGAYDYAYEYDQGGNRIKKTEYINPLTRIEERYYYDIRPEEVDPQDPPEYASFNNRLMLSKKTRFEQQPLPPMGPMTQGPLAPPGGGTMETLLSTTWYAYNGGGNITQVLTHLTVGQPDRFMTTLYYAENERAVTFVVGEEWDSGEPSNITYAREFRYDGARQRYLTRVLNADNLEDSIFTVDQEIWSDYDGDRIYGDYEISGQEVTELRSFEPGLGKVDPWRSAGPTWAEYYHADMIGTTRFTTDSPQPPAEPTPSGQVVYTAFGERIDGAHHRYGYAGAWAYQGPSSDDAGDPYLDFPFLHVGHRYYDPSIGRFLQRDPIGIGGGLNVYEYVHSMPTVEVDPSGLQCPSCEANFYRKNPGVAEAERKYGVWVVAGCAGGTVAGAGARAAAPFLARWAFRIVLRFAKPKPAPAPRPPVPIVRPVRPPPPPRPPAPPIRPPRWLPPGNGPSSPPGWPPHYPPYSAC